MLALVSRGPQPWPTHPVVWGRVSWNGGEVVRDRVTFQMPLLGVQGERKMVERILGCRISGHRGSVPATGQLRGRGGWGHGKGLPGPTVYFSLELLGFRVEGLQVGMGRGAERGGRENGAHRVPPGWGQAHHLLCPPGHSLCGGHFSWVLPVKFQRFHIKLWIARLL